MSTKPLPPSTLAWAVALVGLGGLILLRFHDLAGAFWRADDPALLNHALQSQGLAAFWDPAHWRQLSANNLTPWVTLSLKLDLALFGLRPLGFYVHQLLSLLATVLLGLALLQRFTGLHWAALAVAMFLLGAPAGAVVDTLTTRHYLEGLLTALLALEAFLRSGEAATARARWAWQVLALLAYAVACTAKEIYVPLPLLLLVWPALGSWRTRLQRVAPFLLILGLYALWRRYMLGGFSGGYADPSSLLGGQLLLAYAAALGRFPAYLWGAAWLLPLVLLLVCALRHWRAGPWLLVLGALVLGPLLPLVSFPGLTGPDRYLFLPWFVLCALLAVGVPRLLPNPLVGRAPWLAPSVTLLALASVALPAWQQEMAQRRMRNQVALELELQGRYLWQAGTADIYRPTETLARTYWYAFELCAIRARERDPCPRALLQGMDEQVPNPSVVHLVDGRMQPLDPTVLAHWLQADREGALSAEFELLPGLARWHFGPSEQGRYFLVSPQLGRYQLPRTGTFKVAQTALSFHLLHEDEQGRLTASPLLRVAQGQPLRWARSSPILRHQLPSPARPAEALDSSGRPPG